MTPRLRHRPQEVLHLGHCGRGVDLDVERGLLRAERIEERRLARSPATDHEGRVLLHQVGVGLVLPIEQLLPEQPVRDLLGGNRSERCVPVDVRGDALCRQTPDRGRLREIHGGPSVGRSAPRTSVCQRVWAGHTQLVVAIRPVASQPPRSIRQVCAIPSLEFARLEAPRAQNRANLLVSSARHVIRRSAGARSDRVEPDPGCGAVWLAHLLWEQGVGSSNLPIPTV